MKRLFTISILLLISFNILFGQSDTLTANQIWENYLNTFGDREDIIKIKTYQSFFESNTSRGVIIGRSKVIIPDKLFLEYKSSRRAKIIYVLNGDKGYVKSREGKRPMTEEEIEIYSQVAKVFPELSYKPSESYEEVVVDGNHCYSITIDTGLDTLNYLIYKDSYRVYKITDSSGSTEVLETQKVDNILLVKWLKMTFGEEIMTINYTKFKINKKIRKKYFKL